MDYLTFFAKLAEHLGWPFSIVIIIFILKKPITNIIDKLKKANIKGSKFEFGDQPTQAPVKYEPTSVEIPISTSTIDVQKEFEDLIRRDLKETKIEDHAQIENILISHLASTQLNAAYERVNSSIFGSQVELLRALNGATDPAELNSLKLFYDDAVTKYPDLYKEYSFESYLSFLVNMALIYKGEGDDDGYAITKPGVGYLIYIAEKGLTGFRHY